MRMRLSIVALAALLASGAVGWSPVPNPQSGSRMMTEWGEKVTPENVWRSYPRPQMVRKNWVNLNGLWECAITTGAQQTVSMPWDKANRQPVRFRGEILVPFAVETPLSGVGQLLEPTDLLWYRRTIDVQLKPGERTILHFGGVDFRCQVFIGHSEVLDVPHEGGTTPFSVDITDFVKPGANELTVCVWDPTTDFVGSTGKQVFKPYSCYYTRMGGIWQTVWMESVPECRIADYRVEADIEKGAARFSFGVKGPAMGDKVKVSVFDGDAKVADFEANPGVATELALPKPVKLWSPDSPHLYTFKAAYGKDSIEGYFAMRSFERRKDGKGILRFFLNGKPCFIYGPLDQGWWPDGFLTPPSEEAMEHDIRMVKALGCNMMRKHIKVEPARYYHLCDTLGLLVLQDMPNGQRKGDLNPRYGFYRKEFKEIVDCLRVFPSIVMWIPYNEGWSQPGEFFTHITLDWIGRYDPTRLVGGPSGAWDYEGGHILPQGWANRVTTSHRPQGECEAGDTVDMHIYRGPDMLAANDRRISFLGEFGGLGHAVSNHLWRVATDNWGYGGTGDTATRKGLETTYLGLIDSLLPLIEKGLGGAVYTQTTDVELEINGFMTYDRKVLKFDADMLKAAHEKLYKAAVSPFIE